MQVETFSIAGRYKYELTIPYENDQDLDDIVYEILREAAEIADRRNGFIKADVTAQDGSERRWCGPSEAL